MNLPGVGMKKLNYNEETKELEFELPEPVIIRYQGSHGEYYSFNGVNYDIRFPVSWACQPLDDYQYGPENCNNCQVFGYYNGVFIGYCANCATISEYTRGNGMIEPGLEVSNIHPYVDSEIKDENSMWNVYMQCVELNEIGDTELAKEHDRHILSRTMDDSDSDDDYSGKIETDFDSISFQYSALSFEKEMGTDVSMNDSIIHDFDRTQYWENYWKMREENDEMELGESVFVSVSSTSPCPSPRPNTPENI